MSSEDVCGGESLLTPVRPSRKTALYRRYTVHELVTPTKEGGRAHFTLENVSLGVKHLDKQVFPGLAQACMSRTSVRLSPKDPEDTEKLTRYRKSQLSGLNNDISFGLKTNIHEDPTITPLRSHLPTADLHVKNVYPSAKRRKCENVSHASSGGPKHKRSRTRALSWKEKFYLHVALLLSVLGVAYILIPHDQLFFDELNFESMHHSLSSKVFGQEKAIASLLTSLQSVSLLGMVLYPPVIVVTGGNGVGKTFTMSMISNNFPPPGQSQYVVLQQLPSHEAVVDRFSKSGPHLLVIDNINLQEISSTLKWIKLLHEKAFLHDKLILIVLIFNVQILDTNFAVNDDHVFAEMIENNAKALVFRLVSSGLKLLHVHFLPLDEESVRRCITRSLIHRGIDIDSAKNHVREIIHISEDRHQGCKRVWSRVLALKVHQ